MDAVLIRVRGATESGGEDLNGGARVVLWERHPAHPGGEVFIASDQEVEVALTPAVARALADGRLVRVKPAITPAEANTPITAGTAQTRRKPRLSPV